MSVFSDLLSEYITMKDVGVYPLSQFCGLDRSFMYKIINGKRNPSGEDVVRKMAQFMQLTPREKTDFMDAFYITQMGEEVYYRRKSVCVPHLTDQCLLVFFLQFKRSGNPQSLLRCGYILPSPSASDHPSRSPAAVLTARSARRLARTDF